MPSSQLHFPTGERKIKKEKKKKGEEKKGENKNGSGYACWQGRVLQPLPQCMALLPAWLKDGRLCRARRNFQEQFHSRQEKREQ